MTKEIYLDNAAATPTDRRVISAMATAAQRVGNPSAFNDAGRRAHEALEAARVIVARFLNAHASEVVFCASGSEANTLAIKGLAETADAKHRHIITTTIEHVSVLEPVRYLQKKGWKVSYVPVDELGIVRADGIEKFITSRTMLVSVIYANNEIGTIQPIARIGRMIAAWRKKHASQYPLFHVDACQAAAYLDMNVHHLGADLVTFNGSKVYGPRGGAVLYVRRGVELASGVLGGGQERGRRAGTENVPAAIGLAKALSLLKKTDGSRIQKLRDAFLRGLATVVPDARINGPLGDARLANNINISVPGTDSESLLLELDRHGIRAGSGSACTAHAVEPSHVLKAIGTPKKYLDGALRISLSRYTTKADLERVIKVLPKAIKRVRIRFVL